MKPIKPLSILGLCLAIGEPVSAWAHNPVPSHLATLLCLERNLLFGTLPPIPRNPEARVIAREFPRAGKIAQPGDLANLPPGRYLYVINERGQTIFSVEVPLPKLGEGEPSPNAPILVSHRSLAAYAESVLPGPLHIVAAGEFEIIPGEPGENRPFVREVNNRSSTFPGGADRLGAASTQLGKLGLAIRPGETGKIDFSKIKVDRHVGATERAQNLLATRNDPELRQLLRLESWLARRFPDPTYPRRIDMAAFEAAVKRAADRINTAWDLDPDSIQLETQYGHLATLGYTLPHLGSWGSPTVLLRLRDARCSIREAQELVEQYFTSPAATPPRIRDEHPAAVPFNR